jgi:hypothetical protein
MASTAKPPNPVHMDGHGLIAGVARARLPYAENPVSWVGPACMRGGERARPVPANRVRSCCVDGQRESERLPGCQESVPGTAGRWRPLVLSCSRWGVPGGGECVGVWWVRATLCLPAVLSRACVDAWAGAAYCVSFRAVALVVIWGLALMLHGGRVDYGNTPDNAYSQGSQELNASAGTC